MFVYILMGGIFILSLIVQNSLKSKFAKYSKVPLGVPMAGRDVANAMLQQNGCGDVQVTSVSGQLTDHFNPANRTVNLSEPVYGTNSIAAAAVAAHECGHAVQHKVGYSMLQLRTKMVPIVSFASKTVQWLLLAGIAVYEMSRFRFPARKVAANIEEMAKLTTVMLQGLTKRHDVHKTRSFRMLREECDTIVAVGVAECMDLPEDVKPLELTDALKWVQIYDRLESVLAKLTDLAEDIEEAVLKNV